MKIERKTEKANENRERLEGGKTREEEQERRDRENTGEHKINGKKRFLGFLPGLQQRNVCCPLNNRSPNQPKTKEIEADIDRDSENKISEKKPRKEKQDQKRKQAKTGLGLGLGLTSLICFKFNKPWLCQYLFGFDK